MRQLINSTYITLDGVVESPHLWPSLRGGTSDEHDTIQTELLESCDIVLMGRRTYEGFAPVWSSRSGDPLSNRNQQHAEAGGLDHTHQPGTEQH
jgi:hypothetical protein